MPLIDIDTEVVFSDDEGDERDEFGKTTEQH